MADHLKKEGGAGDHSSSANWRTASEQTPNIEQPSQDAIRGAPRGVRFSEDLDRATALSSLPTFSSSSQRPGTPNLTLDTNTSHSIPRKSVDAPRPAAGILSNRSGTVKRPPSPLSPRTRDRGYSLRRTLFARSIDDRRGSGSASEGESPIELERVEAGYSSQRQGIQAQDEATRRLEEGKEKAAPTGAVFPIIEDELEISVIDSREQPQTMKTGKSKDKNSYGTIGLPNYTTFANRRVQNNTYLRKINAWRKRMIKDFQGRNQIPPSKNGRHIDLDAARKTPLVDERTGTAFIGNMIRSSRYTIYNFVPHQLFFQFSKLANAYFLLVSVLQMVPGLSTTGSYTTIAPLLVFVAISMGKEGYDDVRRYKLDQVENNRETFVLHAYRPVEEKPDEASFAGRKNLGRWLPSKSSSSRSTASRPTGDVLSVNGPKHWAGLKWKDVKVGDIVKLRRDDPVPADMVLLHADGANDIAYIETMALDGETNLKSKQPPVSLAKRCTSDHAIAACHAQIIVEDPNLDLYNFDGRVTIDGESLPLTTNEVVFRGSTLRNTKTAIGMVINTGEECKIRMNANKSPRIKSPAIQAISNRIIVCLVIFVILLSLFCTIAYQIWASSTESKSWYLDSSHVPFSQIIIGFVILYNTLIPLSLYVSLEIIKVGQLLLMNDVEMYDPISDTPMICNTTTILENLGQVDYIFSDKTGTLTENVMRFRKLSVAGYAWLHDFDLQKEAAENEAKLKDAEKPKHKGKGKGKSILKGPMKKKPVLARNESDLSSATTESNALPRRSGSVSLWKSSARPSKQQPEMRTEELLKFMQHKPHSVFTKKAKFFLLSLALCHTCLPEVQENGEIDFQAASPDELALVKAAQEMGYLVIDRAARSITLTYPGVTDAAENITEVYDILDVIEFSSKRKRMSIIVRFPNGRTCIFCKGADSALVPRLKMAPLAMQKKSEITRRSSLRKSIEAEQALRRMSEHSPRASFSRPSMNLSRPSISRSRKSMNHNRSSVSGQSLQPIRDELDSWLRRREHDVEAPSDEEEVNAYRSPRHSMARTSRSMNRMSYASSGSGSIGERGEEEEEDWDEMVDEALVLDETVVFERCFQHIDDFATEGLRTLLFGYRFLDEDEYNGWKKVYLDATTSLIDRQNLIEAAGEMIEQNFDLAGATAIEDKLQKGVPETIDKLRRANIKIWMLTGDKRETAINIAHSARICKNYSEVVILDHTTGEVEQLMATTLLDISKGSIAHSVVVVDGQTLSEIDSNETLKLLFFDLAVVADSVICCRASPSQKASLVKKIRTKVKKSITLAIGDGANDIAMILEANVGIGISGKEGLQAARISDYSIAQFRFLQRLLLVHGRWNYVRTGKYILSTFWKELLFYLMQAFYQRWAGYTGTSLFESTSLTVFNTLFTSLPVIFLGIFEQDLSAATLLAVPELYVQGQRNEGFNIRLYLSWMVMAVIESAVIYFCMFGLFGEALFTQDNGLLSMGTICFTAAIIFINTKMLVLEFHNKTIIPFIGFILSIGGWFLWQIVLSLLYKPGKSYFLYPIKDGFVYYFGRNLLWWLVLFLSLACVIVLELGVKSLRKSFWPSDTDIFQHLQKDPVIRKRFEDSMNAEERPRSSGVALPADSGKKKTSTDLHGEREIQELLSRPRVMPISIDGATDTELIRSPVEVVDPNGLVQRTASGNHLTRRKISMDHGNDRYEAVTGEFSPRRGSNVKTRHSVDIAEVLRRGA